MRQASPAAMKSGSGRDPGDHNQEPVYGHGQREDSNAATPPSDGPPSGAAAEGGGTGASSPSRLPAAPVDRPQERVREQAGGGSRGTNGSSSASATVGVDQEGNGASAPSSAGSSPSNPSPGSALPFGAGSAAVDCKELFEQVVREAGGEEKKPEDEQVDSSLPKQAALWSKFRNLFTRKIVDREREAWEMFKEHVRRQTKPIAEVFDYYRVPEDTAICLNLDAYLRFRPVYGDGECFYRSFIFSYLEQVLDRQDTHEEHRLLDTIKRVSTQYTNLGWTSNGFRRSYKEMHNSLTVVACHHNLTHCWHKLKFEVHCKVNNPILTTMNLKRNPLVKEQLDNITGKTRIAFKKLLKKVMGWKRQGRWSSIAPADSYRKEKLLKFFSTYKKTKDIFVFLRLVAAIQICSHEDDYGQLIPGLNEHQTLKDWCLLYVTPAREFTDHIMMTALARALEVPLRLERLHEGGSDEDNIYTGHGAVSVTLLYTGNHYDIIYPRPPSAESSQREIPTD